MTASRQPHVVLFICDQMQYQRQGRLDPQAYTPQLDRLAAEGIFFSHFHAANGQCVPSRVAMQTGLYPHEAGVMIIYGFHGHTAHLSGEVPAPPGPSDRWRDRAPWTNGGAGSPGRGQAGEQRTVGHVFRDAGYTTAYFGKTHFGTPLERLGYRHGNEGPHPAGADEQERAPRAQGERATRRNSVTDRRIVDDALAFLAQHDPAQPLFLTVSVHQPHPPFELAADGDEIHNRASDPAVRERRAALEARVDGWWRETGGRDSGYYESPEFKLSGAATLVDTTGGRD